MFSTYPWTTYAYATGILIAIYYGIVISIFYRDQLIQTFSQRLMRGPQPRPPSDVDKTAASARPSVFRREGKNETETGRSKDGILEPVQVSSLTGELAAIIDEAHQKQYGKQDLVLLLQMILSDYINIRDTPFGSVINDIIQAECAKYGSIHLGENDLKELWQQV